MARSLLALIYQIQQRNKFLTKCCVYREWERSQLISVFYLSTFEFGKLDSWRINIWVCLSIENNLYSIKSLGNESSKSIAIYSEPFWVENKNGATIEMPPPCACTTSFSNDYSQKTLHSCNSFSFAWTGLGARSHTTRADLFSFFEILQDYEKLEQH